MTTGNERPTLSQPLANASPFGLKVARILDDIWALYNIPGFSRIDFSRDNIVEMNTASTLATFDFNTLTQLVVRCHDACIRLSVMPCNMRYLKLMFHPREREGALWARHPTMEQAIEAVRGRNYFGRPSVPIGTVGAGADVDAWSPISDGQDSSQRA